MRTPLALALAASLLAASDDVPERKPKPLATAVAEWVRRQADEKPEGWIELRSEHFILITDSKPKYAKRILAHAEAVRAHLDAEWSFLSKAPAPMALIRVFAKEADLTIYTRRHGDASLERILLAVKHGGNGDWELGKLGQRLVDHWLFYGNPHLRVVLPYWVHEGLRRHIGWHLPAGKGVKFKLDPYNRKMIREHIRLDRHQEMRDWLSGPDIKVTSDASSRLAGSLVSWLKLKAKQPWSDLLPQHIESVSSALSAAEKRLGMEPMALHRAGKEGRTELTKKLEAAAPEIRRKACENTFRDWDERDWKKIEKAWLRYAK